MLWPAGRCPVSTLLARSLRAGALPVAPLVGSVQMGALPAERVDGLPARLGGGILLILHVVDGVPASRGWRAGGRGAHLRDRHAGLGHRLLDQAAIALLLADRGRLRVGRDG